jgi:hypothetical protein
MLVASVRYTDRRLVRAIEDTGRETPNGEQYLIANPGEGFTVDQSWKNYWGPGVPVAPKPVRNYDAVEFRLDKRFSANYQFAFSYTLSRLYGNYGGLASSDEILVNGGTGRNSPSVNRYYDQPWVYINQNGQYQSGLLGTDRPHTFKLFGSYTLKSKLGHTTFSPNLQAYSGVPITTEAYAYTNDPTYPFGRGDMGRTPFFFNADFNVQHEIMPFKAHEQMKMRFELYIQNLLNSATTTFIYNDIENSNDQGGTGLQFDDYASIFKGWNTKSLMKAQGIRVDPRYGFPYSFQGPRQLRFQVSFFF